MRVLTVLCLFFAAIAPSNASVFRSAGDMAGACRAFAAQPDGFHRTPEGVADPCRKFLDGFFRTLKDKNDAELKAKAEQVRAPAPAGPCVRMPDVLTFRDFATRIAAYDAANPDLRAGSPVALAQKTLEAAFPCPEQSPSRAAP